MTDPKNYHVNAAALIIAAAEKSGLLDDVAQALWFISKNRKPLGEDCPACEILETLTNDFEQHGGAGSYVVDSIWGGGQEHFCIKSFPEAGLAKFRGVETSTAEATS